MFLEPRPICSFHPDASASSSLLCSCCLYACATAPAGVKSDGGDCTRLRRAIETGSAVIVVIIVVVFIVVVFIVVAGCTVEVLEDDREIEEGSSPP